MGFCDPYHPECYPNLSGQIYRVLGMVRGERPTFVNFPNFFVISILSLWVSGSDLARIPRCGLKICDEMGLWPVISLIYPFSPRLTVDTQVTERGNLHLTR